MKLLTRRLGLVLLCTPAFAEEYFVSPAGSNSNDGLTPATAFADIDFALSAAGAASGSAHVVNVLPGSYPIFAPLSLPPNVALEGRPWASLVSFGATPVVLIDDFFAARTESTRVRNLEIVSDPFVGTGVDLTLVRPESAPRVENTHIVGGAAGVWIRATNESQPLVRFNDIEGVVFEESVLLGEGIRVDGDSQARPVVQSNYIHGWSEGIHVDYGQAVAHIRCDWIHNCYTGIRTFGGLAVVSHETIAWSDPAPPVTVVRGVQANPGGAVILTNSIVWCPDGPGFIGMDLDGFAVDGSGPNLAFSTLSEDIYPTSVELCSTPIPHVSLSEVFKHTNSSGASAADPGFESFATGDLRLKSDACAIDRAVASFNWPLDFAAGLLEVPIDYDFFGAPRLQDPFRSGLLTSDLGAHEYNPVSLEVEVLNDVTPHSTLGEALVDASFGSTVRVSVQALPGDLVMFWMADEAGALDAPSTYSSQGLLVSLTNVVNSAGALLALPFGPEITAPIVLPVDAAGFASFDLPFPAIAPNPTHSGIFQPLGYGSERHIQAIAIPTSGSPSVGPPLGLTSPGVDTVGNLTRRVELQLNRRF